MKLYFADTWYFLALINRRDAAHGAAVRLERTLSRVHLITHDAVLSEALTFVAEYGERSRTAAASYVRALLDDPGITVYESGRGLFLPALSLYERRRDKEYSLPDCMSMALMQAHGITHVLTNDHHFRQEGFTVLSDAP